MPVKKRKIKVRTKPKPMTKQQMLERMGDILAAGHGTEEDAREYFTLVAQDEVARLQSIAATADETRSWKHMKGCYSQAMTLYAFASVLYEKFPEHVIMTDKAFDHLARWLNKNWSKLSTEFRNWYNITAMGLDAGSGYQITTTPLIKWMVYVHTGVSMEEADGPPAHEPAGVLRRRPIKRGKRSSGKRRGKLKKHVRKP